MQFIRKKLSAARPLLVSQNVFSGSIAVPTNFIGMHFHSWPLSRSGAGSVTPAPDYPYQIARSHDSAFPPNHIFMANIHTSSGNFDWTTSCDTWVNTHYNAGKDLIYCLYATPQWNAKAGMTAIADAYGYLGGAAPPQSYIELGNFVTALVTRYNVPTRKIKYLEIWNEPNFAGSTSGGSTSGFFMGTAAEMAQMARTVYQAAKAVDSGITIISPGFSGSTWIADFLNGSDGAAGFGRQWIEILSQHYYNSNSFQSSGSTYISTAIAATRAALVSGGLSSNFPLCDSEHGYLNNTSGAFFQDAPENAKSIYIQRVALLEAVNNVQFICWYAHDDAVTLGTTLMLYSAPVLKSALMAINSNLVGKTITNVDLMSDGRLRASFSGGYPDWIV